MHQLLLYSFYTLANISSNQLKHLKMLFAIFLHKYDEFYPRKIWRDLMYFVFWGIWESDMIVDYNFRVAKQP